MPKGSEALTRARREEILNACAKLYEKMDFREITVKDIGRMTSFTRTSIYNYFQTKEEIFLALLQREYDLWIADLERIVRAHEALSADDLAAELAGTLERRLLLLKLMTTNFYDMEGNSRLERLVEFKRSYGGSIRAVRACLDKFCPEMPDANRQRFIFTFFPYIYGIYPYAVVTEKQREAMERAGVGYVYQSVYEMAYNGARMLLRASEQGTQL